MMTKTRSAFSNASARAIRTACALGLAHMTALVLFLEWFQVPWPKNPGSPAYLIAFGPLAFLVLLIAALAMVREWVLSRVVVEKPNSFLGANRFPWVARAGLLFAVLLGFFGGYLGALTLGVSSLTEQASAVMDDYARFQAASELHPNDGKWEAWEARNLQNPKGPGARLNAIAMERICPVSIRETDRFLDRIMAEKSSIGLVLGRTAAEQAWARGCLDDRALFQRLNPLTRQAETQMRQPPAWYRLAVLPRFIFQHERLDGASPGPFVFFLNATDRVVLPVAISTRRSWCDLQSGQIVTNPMQANAYCETIANGQQPISNADDFRVDPTALRNFTTPPIKGT